MSYWKKTSSKVPKTPTTRVSPLVVVPNEKQQGAHLCLLEEGDRGRSARTLSDTIGRRASLVEELQ